MNEFDIPVLFEDDDILVLDKPAGITVNKSETTIPGSTIQDWTEKKLQITPDFSQAEKIADYTSDAYFQQAFLDRGGIVHRLDKETSGILLVAKNWKSFKELLRQFKERLVTKRYLALVHGKLVPMTGEVNVPVDRLPWNRRQFGVVPGGRESLTFYTVKGYFENSGKPKEYFALVELEPKTGRTHQIRVHMKYLNHPIVSDFLYGGRKVSTKDRKLLSRVYLHAANITFIHPVSGETISFESPLPPDLMHFLTLELKEITS